MFLATKGRGGASCHETDTQRKEHEAENEGLQLKSVSKATFLFRVSRPGPVALLTGPLGCVRVCTRACVHVSLSALSHVHSSLFSFLLSCHLPAHGLSPKGEATGAPEGTGTPEKGQIL